MQKYSVKAISKEFMECLKEVNKIPCCKMEKHENEYQKEEKIVKIMELVS